MYILQIKIKKEHKLYEHSSKKICLFVILKRLKCSNCIMRVRAEGLTKTIESRLLHAFFSQGSVFNPGSSTFPKMINGLLMTPHLVCFVLSEERTEFSCILKPDLHWKVIKLTTFVTFVKWHLKSHMEGF